MTRFLVDAMLGKLATFLRMCGYDAAYVLDIDDDRDNNLDDEIATLARESGRTLLTRDVELAGRVEDALLLDSREIDDQLAELRAAGVDLTLADPPRRCGACNGTLERVAGDAPSPAYAPDPGSTPVWRCRDCGQQFGKGSHWTDEKERLSNDRSDRQ